MCQSDEDGPSSNSCPDLLTCYLIRARQGDPDAFELFVECSQIRLLAWVGHYLDQCGADNSWLEAEDIVQAAYCQVWTNLASFDPARKAWPWVSAIARNQAVGHLRKRKPGPLPFAQTGEGETLADRVPSSQEVVQAREERVALQQALAELSDEDRQALTLRYLEGRSYQEICAVMAVQRTALGSLLHRARQRLQTLLARHGIDRDSLRGWVPPDWEQEDDAPGTRG